MSCCGNNLVGVPCVDQDWSYVSRLWTFFKRVSWGVHVGFWLLLSQRTQGRGGYMSPLVSFDRVEPKMEQSPERIPWCLKIWNPSWDISLVDHRLGIHLSIVWTRCLPDWIVLIVRFWCYVEYWQTCPRSLLLPVQLYFLADGHVCALRIHG